MSLFILGETSFLDFRLLNLVLLFGVVSGLIANFVARRAYLSRRTRRIMMWIILILVNLIYVTGDNFVDEIRINPPVVIATLLLAGLLLSILWHPKGDHDTLPHDGSLPYQAVLWLDRKIVRYKRKKQGRLNDESPR